VPTNLFKKDYQQLSAMLAHFKGCHAFPPPPGIIFGGMDWGKTETKSKQTVMAYANFNVRLSLNLNLNLNSSMNLTFNLVFLWLGERGIG